MRRLIPDPGPTTVEEQLDCYRPGEEAREDRPFVAMNFAATVDGRATIGGSRGRSAPAPTRRCWSGCGPASTR